ncbi:hypothetical protein OAX78_04225, partial [Planctomycetota bacterium]|nr:hypothetical protein [Planctomycetota bacterium]
EALKAQRRVAVLRARLGETEEAEAAYAHAIGGLEELHAAAPDDASYARELAVTLLDASMPSRDEEERIDPALAVERATRGLALLESTPADVERDPALMFSAHCRNALAFASAGQPDEAELALERAEELASVLAPVPQGDDRGRFDRKTMRAMAFVQGELIRTRLAIVDSLIAAEDHVGALARLDVEVGKLREERHPWSRWVMPEMLERQLACHQALGNEEQAAEVERLLEETPQMGRGRRRGGAGGGRPPRQ